ncbi:hypothetical protein Dester_0504 [Desulfurobacterium thermolithotrophum DSM 11699]|uniref:Uncharacterized protein n=1 Tax=Desulfurobacterium thermolithotrophum (strain DSM 11699 / BSA) TaxID=868864 RepID=F0S2T4_DESTD|nr:hypothetical protein [Desulfurobacterium thermolithotrophum]ADY73156.1 hypothetical protein Dester_0504 [Desulfurobacterium thermolithotrophum DSM 11699]
MNLRKQKDIRLIKGLVAIIFIAFSVIFFIFVFNLKIFQNELERTIYIAVVSQNGKRIKNIVDSTFSTFRELERESKKRLKKKLKKMS